MRLLLALVVGVCSICTACASSSDVAGERRNVGSVTMTFTVSPARAKAGQTVRLTIRLVNNSGRPTALSFPTSQRYDFWITQGEREVWRWSADRVFTQDVTREDLGGQTGMSFAESWRAAETGDLVAHARLTAQSYEGEMKGAFRVG